MPSFHVTVFSLFQKPSKQNARGLCQYADADTQMEVSTSKAVPKLQAEWVLVPLIGKASAIPDDQTNATRRNDVSVFTAECQKWVVMLILAPPLPAFQ